MELEELARKYALKNASEYGGECNPGAVIGKIMSEEDFEPGKVQEVAGKVCGEVNSMSQEEQEEELEGYEFEEKDREHDPVPDLKNAEEGEVVVRFAPNPNSPPHIGHARGMVINGELKQKYDGKLILRFDDTDPRNKRPLKTEEHNAYEMYREDHEWLGYNVDEVRYSSKNFDRYYEVAKKLIEKGKAYVSKASREEMQEYREKGIASEYREQSVEENMDLWEKMLEGGIEEGEAVLKVKTDVDHKNPAVRDFVAFRIIEYPDHPLTGDSYRAWPLLDFQGAVEDHDMGTTHIVRGKDLRASTKRQKYVYDYLGWDYPEVMYWGNVNVSGFEAPVSSSSLKELIDAGELEGWDDVRAPTVRALRKRGFRSEAIKNFFIEMGVTENDVDASVDTLESHNRDIVEDSDRCFFVRKPAELVIEDVPGDLKAEIPLHPDHPERGSREHDLEVEGGKLKVLVEESDISEGFLRLKGLCNVEIEDGRGRYVEGDHTEAVERNAPIVHWVPLGSPDAEVVMPDGEKVSGRIEESSIEPGEVVQFERFGFARRSGEKTYKFFYAHE